VNRFLCDEVSISGGGHDGADLPIWLQLLNSRTELARSIGRLCCATRRADLDIIDLHSMSGVTETIAQPLTSLLARGQLVQGVIFEIPDELLNRNTVPRGRRSFDARRPQIRACSRHCPSARRIARSSVQAITYTARENQRKNNIRTSLAYVTLIVAGPREHGAEVQMQIMWTRSRGLLAKTIPQSLIPSNRYRGASSCLVPTVNRVCFKCARDGHHVN
jgi:hypothetical protein